MKYKNVYDVNFYYRNFLNKPQVIKTQVDANSPKDALESVEITYNLYDVSGRYTIKELDKSKF